MPASGRWEIDKVTIYALNETGRVEEGTDTEHEKHTDFGEFLDLDLSRPVEDASDIGVATSLASVRCTQSQQQRSILIDSIILYDERLL